MVEFLGNASRLQALLDQRRGYSKVFDDGVGRDVACMGSIHHGFFVVVRIEANTKMVGFERRHSGLVCPPRSLEGNRLDQLRMKCNLVIQCWLGANLEGTSNSCRGRS